MAKGKPKKTKKQHVLEICKANPDISPEDGMREMRKRRVPITKNGWHQARTLLRKEGLLGDGRRRKGGKRKRATTPREAGDELSIPLEVQNRLLEEKNAKLKAAIAVLL